MFQLGSAYSHVACLFASAACLDLEFWMHAGKLPLRVAGC